MLLLMRGLPLSGKSTRARQLALQYNAVICCPDDYHYDDHVFNFKFNRVQEFAQQCQARAWSFLRSGCNVVVDAMNLTNESAEPYLEMARALGCTVLVVVCTSRYLGKDAKGTWRNMQSIIDQMALRLEPLDLRGCAVWTP
jgi:predicted kinase